ncbi:MAG: hypothetical protein JSW47_14955, partial [Phycisphaerales bacterium]
SYIVLTKLFSDMWRGGIFLRSPSLYLDANAVAWAPGRAQGLEIRPSGGDGVWRASKFEDTVAVVAEANAFSSDSRYLYFNVDDAFAYDLFDKTVVVSVTYRDAGCKSFHVEYDNVDPGKGAIDGAFRRSGSVAVKNKDSWKTAEFSLERCRFMNRCNGADLRIVVLGGEMALAVSKVKVMCSKAAGDK